MTEPVPLPWALRNHPHLAPLRFAWLGQVEERSAYLHALVRNERLREERDELCRQAGTEFEWREGNGLRTRQSAPAIVRHPETGELAFFNQLQLHHVSCLEPAVRESLTSLMSEEDLPRNVYYGDGSRIEDSVMQQIGGVYRENAVAFPWEPGDVLMLNNMLVAHSRNPYVGPRKIVVAMGEMVNQKEIRN